MTSNEPLPAPGVLYLVATPIGNLEDITYRAVRILGSVSLVVAEDTRHTRILLNRYTIKQRLLSFHEHSNEQQIATILTHLTEGDVALVSDAGTPGISDPGYQLVVAAVAAGFSVVSIPGPSAPVAALAASGLPTDGFIYAGFVPRRSSDRLRFWEDVCTERRTIVAFETPHRLVASLVAALEVLGDRPIAVARELTKVHEEYVRGTISQAITHFTGTAPRGEFTLVIGGASAVLSPPDPSSRMKTLTAEGRSAADIATTVARETGSSRRAIYRLLLDLQKDAKM